MVDRRYVFRLTIEPADGMGLDKASVVKDMVEEALRDSGMDNAANIELELIVTDGRCGHCVYPGLCPECIMG